MSKRLMIVLAGLAVLFVLIFGFHFGMGAFVKHMILTSAVPPQSVSTIKATQEDWQPKLESVGSLRAVQGSDLSSEVAGIVEETKFESGTDVEAGTVLVQLRAEDDIAKLLTLQAAAKLAEINYNSDEKQLKVQAVSQAAVDTDIATLAGAKAQVAEQQAVVDKKTIRAPFAGHLGIRMIDVGQYLNPGTAIVTLQQLDPIFVDFNLPERALTHVSLGQKTIVHVDAHADKTFEGEITAINSKIDDATRNIQVRATFKNPDHMLLPGMFAKIAIESGAPQKFITVPQTAITFNPYGSTVYLAVTKSEAAKADEAKKDEDKDAKDEKDEAKDGAKDDNQLVAKQVFVTTGETRGDQIAVLTGVKAGDTVVTSGQMKLRQGMPIVVNNEIQPSNDPNPKPKDR
jgi:membrane fusion protein (multidrug efflux system)